MNFVLIGSRCAGKTETGRALAGRLGRLLVDTDDMVEERMGISISEIVRTGGWERFRDLEAAAVREVSRLDGLIVATGGGVVIRESNMRRLRRNGWIVWLRAREETLAYRMQGDPRSRDRRPVLRGAGSAEEIRDLLLERTPLYRSAGDMPVDTDGIRPFDVAARILALAPEAIER